MTDMERHPYVYTGPGTMAGQYLRQFWHPIYEAAKLDVAQAVTIKLLGERFTLYRDEQDMTHLVSDTCPHRNTVLSTGWVEGSAIRCFYHGWKFASDGQCIEQPAEPKPFCKKIRIANYPTAEHLGLIFVFIGEGTPPSFPCWPEFEKNFVSSIAQMPCNYFQSAENIMDDVHVGFSHRGVAELSGSARGYVPPEVSAEETAFGLTAYFRTGQTVERNHWIMPNICMVGYDLVFKLAAGQEKQFRAKTLFWYVPIDDESHYHVMVTVPGSPFVLTAMKEENSRTHCVTSQINEVLAGKSQVHKGIVTPAQGKVSNLIRTQDGVAIVGQGAITDRNQEHLGASDAAIVLLRRVWRRTLKDFSGNDTAAPFNRPDDVNKLLLKHSLYDLEHSH